jgi:hypothetical protein
MPVVFQIEKDAGPKLWWILSGKAAAGGERTFVLVSGGSAANAPLICCNMDSSSLIIQFQGKNILQYRHAMVEPPAGAGPLFRHNGFIHPLWSPHGTIMTESSPPNHIHHMGIWSAWNRTVFEGKPVDFWNLGEGQGTVRFDIKVIDAGHPATEGFPAVWKWQDECYYLDHLNPDIHILLAADLRTIKDDKMTEYPGTTFGDYFPLAWSHQFDGGREFYTAMGHKIEHYSDPLFLKHLWGGIQWAIGDAIKLDPHKIRATMVETLETPKK